MLFLHLHTNLILSTSGYVPPSPPHHQPHTLNVGTPLLTFPRGLSSLSAVSLLSYYSLERLCTGFVFPFPHHMLMSMVTSKLLRVSWLFKPPLQSLMESPHTHRAPAASLNATKYTIPVVSSLLHLLSLCSMATSGSYTLASAFASAFPPGIFWIEEPDTSYDFGRTASRIRRFHVLLPLPTTEEFIPLFEDVELGSYDISIDC